MIRVRLVVLLFVGCCVEGYELWQLRTMRNQLSVAAQSRNDDDVLIPEIGTAQVLKPSGFSIELSAAEYVNVPVPFAPMDRHRLGPGIRLAGLVGNSTNRCVSDLSMKFLRPSPAKKNRYETAKLGGISDFELFFSGPEDMSDKPPFQEGDLFPPPGLAELTQSVEVGELSPGRRKPFEVTVYYPGLHPPAEGATLDSSETKDSIRITVGFSGERYSMPSELKKPLTDESDRSTRTYLPAIIHPPQGQCFEKSTFSNPYTSKPKEGPFDDVLRVTRGGRVARKD